MSFVFSKITRYILFAYLFYTGANYLLRSKSYNISPKQFKSIATKSANLNSPSHKTSISNFISGFRNTYGDLLIYSPVWHTLQLGNLDLNLYPLYLDFTEFAVILGSSFETSGRIGLHWSNTTCTVLSGSASRQQDSGNLEEATPLPVGTVFRHGQFESYHYRLAENTYIACYGRGLVPVSGVWAATSGLSRGEPVAVGQLFSTFVQTVYNRISMSIFKTYHHYKAKVNGEL